MKKLILMSLCLLFFCAAVMAPSARADVVWHDPQLNWDFWNTTGQNADDLDIVVENPNFNPNLANPSQVWSVPFQTVTLSNLDHDGDLDLDTRVRYSNASVPPAAPGGIILPDSDGMPYGNEWDCAHGGLYMKGSGLVLDAYWTMGGVKVGPSYPITYEQTRVEGDPALYMELRIAKGFFDDPENYGKEAGWTEIRTFVNIPADLLDLPDINKDLDLSTLAAYEVTPKNASTGLPILPGDVILMGDPDSFFDVFLSDIDPAYANDGYEALLVATVVTSASEPIPAGAFWNLNPQSPEPATIVLLGLGGLLLRRRKR